MVLQRRLTVDLGVGELVHHVLHRSRGARWLLAQELGDVEAVLGVGPRDFFLMVPQSAASMVSDVSTPLKAAHVVPRSGASPSAALWSMFSAKPSACPRIELIFAIASAVSFCELRSAFAFELIISLIVLVWRLIWVLASSVAFAYLRCSASRDLPSSRIWRLRFSMWVLARLRYWSSTVDLVSDVETDVAPFPLALPEPAGLCTLVLDEFYVGPSSPAFL